MTEVRGLHLSGGGASVVRRPRLPWPLDPAATVVVLAGGLIFVIVAIFVFLCFQGYATTIEGAKAKAQSATDVVAQNIDLTLDGGLAALKLVAALVPDPAGITQAQKATVENALQSFPTTAQLGFYLPDGSVATTDVSTGLPQGIATLPALAALRSGADFVVLPQQSAGANGDTAIAVMHRLGGDTFQGAVLLSIPGSMLQSLWATQDLGKDSTININLETGEMVGRYPPLPAPVNANSSPNWPMISAADSGTYIATSPIDQVQRVVGFRHIRDLGIVVFATVSLDAAIGGLWNSIIIVSWLIAPIALALLVGSLITAGLLRRSARIQANLAKALASNDVLFREIHHRVKNNLQSVASLFQMQPIPREVKADMSQRIAAMSAVHEHIYRSDDFAHVRVKQYLQTLIGSIRAGQPNVQVIEDLQDLSVDKDSATPLGLILNEVVSNSFKHAFKDGRAGVVTVHLRQTEDGTGCLTVDDNGVGFDPSVPAKGIGRRLIAALTQQLGGESGFSSSSGGGARFVLSFPLSRPD
jgi:two-component sensor histidine kinase